MNENTTTNIVQWTPRGELNAPKSDHDRIVRIHVHMSQLVTAEAGLEAKRRGWSMSKIVQEAVEQYLQGHRAQVEDPNSLTIPNGLPSHGTSYTKTTEDTK